MGNTTHIDNLMAFVLDVEVEKGINYLLELAEKESDEFVLKEVIEPFLDAVGNRWKEGKGFTITDTYVSSKIVKQYFEKLIVTSQKEDANRKVIMGNIKNDFQSSGRKLVIRFLEMAGWQVIDLGNDVEPEVFVQTAIEKNVKFIGVSAMLYENALGITELIELIEDRFDEDNRPCLVAGGAIFNVVPTLAESLNIENTASNAYEAVKLFNRLYGEVSDHA